MTNSLTCATGSREPTRNLRILVPNVISALRILAIPFIFICLLHDRNVSALVIFITAGMSDVLDGYLARKLHARSSFGAYLDATADFSLILSVYVFFCVSGTVHLFIVLLIVFMFAQFIVTSRAGTLVYDPVGKRFGAVLFVSIASMMLYPQKPVPCVSCYLVALTAAVSLSTRAVFLSGRWMRRQRLGRHQPGR
jgi:phosphatidylglycerophosphate synthase